MAKHSDKLILVTGATGKQGGAAMRHLRERGFSVRAMTRDPNKPEAVALAGHGTEVVRGDMDDDASLDKAMDGVDGVYSVQASRQKGGPEVEIRQGIKVAEAARRADVGHLVYSSVASADQNTGIPHFDSKFQIEEHVRQTGIPYTILRPVFFMENLLGQRGNVEQGVFAQPLKPETKLQIIAVDDIGAFVALAFEHPGIWHNRIQELAGDEASMIRIAEDFSRRAGRDVKYPQILWEGFEQQAGPEITAMYRWFENVGYHVDIAQRHQEYSRLTSFPHWLNMNW